MLDLVESGRPAADVARDLQISDQTIYTEHAELIADALETEVAIHRRATELLEGSRLTSADLKRRFATST